MSPPIWLDERAQRRPHRWQRYRRTPFRWLYYYPAASIVIAIVVIGLILRLARDIVRWLTW